MLNSYNKVLETIIIKTRLKQQSVHNKLWCWKTSSYAIFIGHSKKILQKSTKHNKNYTNLKKNIYYCVSILVNILTNVDVCNRYTSINTKMIFEQNMNMLTYNNAIALWMHTAMTNLFLMLTRRNIQQKGDHSNSSKVRNMNLPPQSVVWNQPQDVDSEHPRDVPRNWELAHHQLRHCFTAALKMLVVKLSW